MITAKRARIFGKRISRGQCRLSVLLLIFLRGTNHVSPVRAVVGKDRVGEQPLRGLALNLQHLPRTEPELEGGRENRSPRGQCLWLERRDRMSRQGEPVVRRLMEDRIPLGRRCRRSGESLIWCVSCDRGSWEMDRGLVRTSDRFINAMTIIVKEPTRGSNCSERFDVGPTAAQASNSD